MKIINKTLGLATFAVVAGFISVAVYKSNVSAADLQVGNGYSTIQAAINAANNGDRVIIPAGTYNESFRISGKSGVELVGQGQVIIRSVVDFPSSNGSRKGIDIQNSSNITVKNVTLDGIDTPTTSPGWTTGIDAVGTPNLTISDVTVKNYGKNGIAITAAHGSSLQTENVTLHNVTVDNAGWAGIAFYGIEKQTGNQLALNGVSFTGQTSISNTSWGIQIGDGSDAVVINGGEIELSGVNFSNNEQHLSNDQGQMTYLLSSVLVDGEVANESHFGGVNVQIDSDIDVPGVPNTGTLK